MNNDKMRLIKILMPILTTTALLLLSSILSQNKVVAQTIIINNITGGFKNATGTILIKDISQITNSTALSEKILSQMSNDSNKQELKSIDTSQIHWWQYNAGSRFAP
jgi:hypothetical protein